MASLEAEVYGKFNPNNDVSEVIYFWIMPYFGLVVFHGLNENGLKFHYKPSGVSILSLVSLLLNPELVVSTKFCISRYYFEKSGIL